MKKIVSLFIAITLILALCPLSFAADIFDGYTYVFLKDAFKDGTPAINTKEALTEYAPGNLDLNKTSKWRFAALRTVSGIGSGSGGVWWRGYSYDDIFVSTVGMEIYVEKGGKYKPTLTYSAQKHSPKVDVWLVKEDTTVKNTFSPNGFTTLDDDKSGVIYNFVKGLGETGKLGTVDMWGEGGSGSTDFGGIELELDEDSKYYLIFSCFDVSNSKFERYNYDKPNNSPMYEAVIKSFSLTYVPTETEKTAGEAFDAAPDSNYTKAPETAYVTRFAYYGDGVQAKKIGETATVDYGASTIIDGVAQTYTDTETGKTYNFSYWAKGLDNGVGNKQILSTALSFSYKPHDGSNYLIAVYEEEDKAQEAFYNYNGQLLTKLKIENNELPALPAMAGLGNAIKWVQRGTNLEFDGGAQAPTNGDMVFMAKYNEPAANITINGEKKYSYDEEIICQNLPSTGYNEATFSYWTRKLGDGEPEIVSLDPDYSFYAFTDCTIAAVCEGKIDTITNARKILLSTFAVGDNLTAVMAEFIGFDEGVKEKGIMFGNNKKIAMTSNFAQFTVTNDTDAPVIVTGYAIVGDDKYVGGEVTVAAKE